MRTIDLAVLCTSLLLISVSARETLGPKPYCVFLPERGVCVARVVRRPDNPFGARELNSVNGAAVICLGGGVERIVSICIIPRTKYFTRRWTTQK
ncbi:hypothetical protein CHS0354_014056, partial [Potamilus streckersoni]